MKRPSGEVCELKGGVQKKILTRKKKKEKKSGLAAINFVLSVFPTVLRCTGASRRASEELWRQYSGLPPRCVSVWVRH